jgi:hypothetical protein
VETLTRLSGANDVVVAADGSIIISQAWGGQLWRLAPGSRTPAPYLRAARATEPFDFAARETFGDGLALDPHGGLLAVGRATRYEESGTELTYVPNGPTAWTLAALRDTRTSRRGVSAVIETTQPGTATLAIVRRGRTVARATQSVGTGHSTLRAIGPIGAHWYQARLQLDSSNGAPAVD